MWLHVEIAELIIILHVMLAVEFRAKYGLRQIECLVYKKQANGFKQEHFPGKGIGSMNLINLLVVTMLVTKSIQQVPSMSFLWVIIKLMGPVLS